MGCCTNVANVALQGIKFSTVKEEHAFGIIAYAVELCKTHDFACGGPLQIGMVAKDYRYLMAPQMAALYSAAAVGAQKKIPMFIEKTVQEHVTDQIDNPRTKRAAD